MLSHLTQSEKEIMIGKQSVKLSWNQRRNFDPLKFEANEWVWTTFSQWGKWQYLACIWVVTWRRERSWPISPTCLHKAFTRADPRTNNVKFSVSFCAFGIFSRKSFDQNVNKNDPWYTLNLNCISIASFYYLF